MAICFSPREAFKVANFALISDRFGMPNIVVKKHLNAAVTGIAAVLNAAMASKEIFNANVVKYCDFG